MSLPLYYGFEANTNTKLSFPAGLTHLINISDIVMVAINFIDVCISLSDF